jgi:SCP-2 sterol transfer family
VLAALFTDEWLADCNAALGALTASRVPGAPRLVVTELISSAPPDRRAAITLIADDDGVRLAPGEDATASAWLTVSMPDAEALHAGTLDPARALVEGRIRIRGDLRAVVDAVGMLAAAHDAMRARRGDAG